MAADRGRGHFCFACMVFIEGTSSFFSRERFVETDQNVGHRFFVKTHFIEYIFICCSRLIYKSGVKIFLNLIDLLGERVALSMLFLLKKYLY